LLRLADPPLDEWDVSCIAPDTRAFALDPGRIYMHDRERFARGRLSPREALDLREEVARGLLGLATADGRSVVQSVRYGEELYPDAPGTDRPDLVCVPHAGFDLKAKFDREELFGFFGRRGMHTPDDVFCYDSAGPGLERVRDAGAAVLDHLLHPKTILI
jgi:predicted AlkP superfamily phosphohydrolase/phosphomutase